MSIWATWLALSDDDHLETCAAYVQRSPGLYDLSGRPCDCGQPNAPYAYPESHVMPTVDMPHDGTVDVAAIPDFITTDGRDDGDSLNDWLRLSVTTSADDAVVVLDRRQVTQLRDTLTAWLDAEHRE